MEILVVGHGFVGEAVCLGMRRGCSSTAYDIKNGMHKYGRNGASMSSAGVKSMPPLKELVTDEIDVVFVCLPTPMNQDGSCNLDIVKRAIFDLDKYAEEVGIVLPVIIKSTVPPGTTRDINDCCDNLEVMFSPEFLTEANSIDDFKNQDRILIGTTSPESIYAVTVSKLFDETYPGIVQYITQPETMEMVKYVTNCFLATKVSFANEIYQLCQAIGVNYDLMINTAKLDKRLGESHWQVPGPMPLDDGSNKPPLGWGGSCFPKDTNSLMYFAKQYGIDLKVLKGAIEKNHEVRPEKDWLNLKGRAVTE